MILELSMVLKLMVCWVLTKNRKQLGNLLMSLRPEGT